MPFIPSEFEELEDSLCTALAGLMPGFEVTYFSDIELDFKRAFVKPRVSVMVHSGKSGDLLDTNIALSEESVFIQVCLESRSRRGAGGIYDLKQQVVAILNGLKLSDWERIIYGDFKYSERNGDGVWVYNALFTTKGVNEQAFDDGYPALVDITAMATDLPTIAPVVGRIWVANLSPDLVVIRYDKALNVSIVPAIGDFSISGKNITTIGMNENSIGLTVSAPFVNGEPLSVSYTPGVNVVQDMFGNLATGFTWLVGNNHVK